MTLRTIVRMISTSATAIAAFLMLQTAAAIGDGLAKNLTPQPLVTALEVFAADTGLQLVYRAEIASGLQSKGARAGLSAEETLQELLRETGLTFEFLNDRTVAIRLASGFSGSSGTNEGSATQSNLMPDGGAQGSATSGNWFDRFRLAQAETSSASAQQGKVQKVSESQDLPAPEETTKGIPEVLVEGSKVLNMDIRRTRDDPQPYVTFDRTTIEKSGAASLEDFFKTRLTMNTQATTNSQSAFGLNSRQSLVNLRGIGANQTLILVDGHRAPTSAVDNGPRQADLNGIPLAAIERIEILPTTASGIYGGGATGGVINVITRRDYEGLETKLTYENTFDTDAPIRKVDLAGGFNLEGGKTNILIAGSWSDASSPLIQDRDFVQRGRANILANNGNNYQVFRYSGVTPPLGATTNIRSANGSNLTLDNGTALNSPITYVPVGYLGQTAGDGGAALVVNAGEYNLNLANSAQNALGQSGELSLGEIPEVRSLRATLRRGFTAHIQAFLDASIAKNIARYNGDIAFTSNQPVFTLSATAPNNPFQQDIQVTVPSDQGRAVQMSTVDTPSVVGGVIVKLPREWMVEADYAWNQSRFSYTSGLLLFASAAAVNTAVNNGTLDVLRDTNAYPLDFRPYLNPASGGRGSFKATLKDASLRLAGPVLSLPAGPAKASFLVAHRDESFADGYFVFAPRTFIYPSRSQSVDSVYAELYVPLVSAKNKLPAVQTLELQVSGRRDAYTTHGVTAILTDPTPATPIFRSTNKISSTDPSASLRYQPVQDLALRASYGTGFLPPTVNQVLPSPPSTLCSGTDPLRGNTTAAGYTCISGGNPNLQPEDSKSWSSGVVLTPHFVSGLRLSVDYTKVNKTNNIANAPALATLVTYFPDRITRGPNLPGDQPGWAGPITAVDQTLVNVAKADIEAYDVQFDYRKPTANMGTFDFFALATWQTHYEQQFLPNGPIIENVGVTSSNPLKFKANGGVTWNSHNWTLGWAARYLDSYLVAIDAPTILSQGNGGRVPSQIYHDAFAAYRFGTGALRDTEITLGAKNIFNKEPPFDAANFFGIGYYSPYGDPRLASYWLSIKKNFEP